MKKTPNKSLLLDWAIFSDVRQLSSLQLELDLLTTVFYMWEQVIHRITPRSHSRTTVGNNSHLQMDSVTFYNLNVIFSIYQLRGKGKEWKLVVSAYKGGNDTVINVCHVS